MQKNKFTTYLLYAIGEIVLVVIGILIAISLNSWNARKIRTGENEKLLINLIKDIERDVARFHNIAEVDSPGMSLRTAITNCQKLKRMSYIQLNSELADSLLYIGTHAGLPVLNSETSVYDQLKSTGRLYSIGSDTLHRKIVDYYRGVFQKEAYINRFNDMMLSILAELDFLASIRLDKQNDPDFDLKTYPWLFYSQSPEMKDLRVAIDKLEFFQRMSHLNFTKLGDQASELIEEIELELDKE